MLSSDSNDDFTITDAAEIARRDNKKKGSFKIPVNVGASRFTCENCDKSFKYKTDRTKHKKYVHVDPSDVGSTESRFACEKCDKSFKYKKGLTEHQRSVHTEPPDVGVNSTESRFACDNCNKSFKTPFIKMYKGPQDHYISY